MMTARKRKSGYNRRVTGQKKEQGGWFFKLLLLCLLAGAVYAGFTVPIHGKTAYAHLADAVRNEVTRTGAGHKGGLRELDSKPAGDLKANDRLTGKDRKELQDLIDSKVKDPGKKQ
jgi:hypothetical protein